MYSYNFISCFVYMFNFAPDSEIRECIYSIWNQGWWHNRKAT